MKFLAPIALALAVSACGMPPVAYNHPSATITRLHQDRAECAGLTRGTAPLHQAGAGVSRGAFNSCMAGKGYLATPNGRLVVPDGMKIKIYD